MLKNITYIVLFFVKEIKDIVIMYKNIILYSFRIRLKKNSHFLDYLKLNENYWKKFDTEINSKPKVLIADFVPRPGSTVTSSIIGKFLSNIENFSLCGFVRSGDIRAPMIIKSFRAKNIFRLSRGGILNRLKFFIKSIKILNKINDIDEFLKFKHEKVNIGMAVYDHIIRYTGVGSINKISSFKFYYFLSLALGINEYCNKFFKNNSIHSVILSERKWLPGSIIFENALLNDCKVYYRAGGTKKINVRTYSNISERFVPPSKFSEKLVNYVFNNMKETALEESNKFIKKKKEEDLTQMDLLGNLESGQDFISKNKKLLSKKEISQILGWDEQKPIVGIFNHSFIDGLFDVEWKVFRDHLIWFRSTLKCIKHVKSVNWIIKDHPYSRKEHTFSPRLGAKTNAEEQLNQIAPDCDHITLFDEKYSASSLLNCLSAVVTCQGTVGLEYPCFGIPAILASDSYYAGFGFTNEPRTESEYFSLLKNINNLDKYKLSQEQIDKAKIYFYIAYKLCCVDVPLLPYFIASKSFDEKKFWPDLIDKIKKHNGTDDYFYKMLKKQIKDKNRHTIDLNLLKYPNMSF